MIKTFAAALRRAFAALATVTLVAVVEAGRLTWKAVRSAFVPADRDAADEQEAEVAALQEARQEEPVRASEAETKAYAQSFGLNAIRYLAGDAAEHAQGRDGLDRCALRYLDSLNLAQARLLVGYDPLQVAGHLLRERHLPGLPRVPSAVEEAEIMRAEYAEKAAALVRTAEAAEEASRILDESVKWMLDPRPDPTGALLGRC